MTAWPKKKKETHAGPSAVGIAAPVGPVGIALVKVETLVPREIAYCVEIALLVEIF